MEKLNAAKGAPKTESDVFEHTICGCTSFNTRGNGHPLLVNKKTTARIASTGTPYKTLDVAWDELQEWQVKDSIVDRALVDIFAALDLEKDVDGVSQENAMQVLTTLSEYILEKFTSSTLPVDDDSESEDEDDPSGNMEEEIGSDEEDDDSE